jgi:hypothetical protein
MNVLVACEEYTATVHGSVSRSKTFSGIAEAMANQWGCLE